MTDQTGQNDQTTSGEMNTQDEKPTVDVEALMGRLDKLEAHNQNLSRDVKEWRTKYKGLKSEAEEKEVNEMQQSENFKGLYEKQQEKVLELQESMNSMRKNSLKSAFKYEVAKHAPDAQDTELLIAALQKKQDKFAYDNDNSKWEGIDSALDEVRSETPFLFKQEKVQMVNGRPAKITEEKPKTVDEMDKSEIMGSLKDDFAELFTQR